MAGEKQFKEKLKLLNEDFMNFISSSFQENPFYDFTPTVTDYLNHVKNLDAMYAEKQPTERKIAVAKRRIATPAVKPKEILKPAIPEPKKLSNGLVEPIGQFAFAPKVQMPEIPSAPVKTPVFSAPKSSDAPTPSSQSRKRRQEVFNSSLFGTKPNETPNNPASNNSLFGTKSNEATSGNSLFGAKSAETTSTPLSSNFIFGGSSKSGEATNTPTINSSLFGTKSGETTNTPLSGNSLFGGSIKSGSTPNAVPITNSLFGGSVKQDDKTNTPPTNNFLFGSKPDEKTNTLSSNTSLFGTKPSETTSNNSLFGGSVKSNEPSNAVPITSSLFGGLAKPGETTNTTSSSNSLFGGLVKPGQLSFNFKGPENSATSAPTNGEADNKDGEEGDAEDAPP
uniref:Uncharacterized protein n=1 Tax=Panagrolaimus sp. ES5 TaxID=591445 RepID=A0AC34G8F2_9BILA